MAITPIKQLKPIQPLQQVPQVDKIEQINPVEAIKPITGFRSISNYKSYQPKQTKTFLADYNDPKELNSFIDALFNFEAMKNSLGDWVDTAKWFALPQVEAAAIAKLVWDKGVQPIVQGKPKEAMLNSLMNLGETLDVVANPVKGFIQESSSGFVKGLGMSKEGRVNYDWDTGNFATDFGLEMVTDPLNYIDLGISGLAKMAVKGVVKNSVESVTKNTVEEIAQLTGTTVNKDLLTKDFKKIFTTAVHEYNKLNLKAMSVTEKRKAITSIRQTIQVQLFRKLKKRMPTTDYQNLLHIYQRFKINAAQNNRSKIMFKSINNYRVDKLASGIVKSLDTITATSNAFQGVLIRGALYSSGLSALGAGAYDIVKGTIRFANAQSRRHLKEAKYINANDKIDFRNWEKLKEFYTVQTRYMRQITQSEDIKVNQTELLQIAVQQLEDYRIAVTEILRSGKTPSELGAELRDYFVKTYGRTPQEFLEDIKHFNTVEQELFTPYINFFQSVLEEVNTMSITTRLGVNPTKGSQLTKTNDIASLVGATTKQAQKIIKELKTNHPNFDSEAMYVFKLSNTAVNLALAEDKTIKPIFSEIGGSTGLGHALNEFINNPDFHKSDVSVEFINHAKALKQKVKSIQNMQIFSDEIGRLALASTEKTKEARMKLYILDAVFQNEDIANLLANFEGYAIPAFVNRLKTLVNDEQMLNQILDNPLAYESLIGAYKRFLEAQQRAGIVSANSAIPTALTDDIYQVVTAFERMQIDNESVKLLRQLNSRIYAVMQFIKDTNLNYYDTFFTDSETIFKRYTTRDLLDFGLALETVAEKKNLDLFNFPERTIAHNGSFYSAMNTLGKRINNYYTQALKNGRSIAEKCINSDGTQSAFGAALSKVYTNTLAQIKQLSYDEITQPPFTMYLKETTDPDMQLIQLGEMYADLKRFGGAAEFRKIVDRATPFNLFKSSSNPKRLQKRTRNLILRHTTNPLSFVKSVTPLNPRLYSKQYADKRLTVEKVNVQNRYKDLDKEIDAVKNDFKAIRAMLEERGLSKPHTVLIARAIKVSEKYTQRFEQFADMYDSLIDEKYIENALNSLAKVILENPWFGKLKVSSENVKYINLNYKEVYDKLQQFWKNEIELTDTEFIQLYQALKEVNLDYALIQRRTATEQGLRGLLSEAAYAYFFIAQPSKGHTLLNILRDKNYNMSQTDYEIYYEFLTELANSGNLKVSSSADESYRIPIDFLPASVIGPLYEFYYRVFDIESPVALIKFTQNSVGGYFLRFDKTVNIYLPSPKSHEKRRQIYPHLTDLVGVLSTIKHETTHATMDRVFDGLPIEVYQEFLENVLHKIKLKLGDTDFWAYFKGVFETYFLKFMQESEYTVSPQVVKIFGAAPNMDLTTFFEAVKAACTSLEEQRRAYTFLEELYTHAIGGTTQLGAQLARGSTRPFAQIDEIATSLSKELWGDLIEFVKQYNKTHTEEHGILAHTKKEYKNWITNQYIGAYKDNEIEYIDIYKPFVKQQELNRLINTATAKHADNAILRFLNLSPDDMVTELTYRYGMVAFTDKDLQSKATKGLTKRLQNIKDPRIGHAYFEGKHVIYLKRLTKSDTLNKVGRVMYLNGNPVFRKPNYSTITEFTEVDAFSKAHNGPEWTDLLNQRAEDIEALTGSKIGDSQGESLTQELMLDIYHKLPEEVQKDMLINETILLQKDMFNTLTFNETILGTRASKLEWGFNYGSNLIVNTKNAISVTQHYTRAKVEYTNFIFDDVLGINSSNSVWKYFSDKDLYEALIKNPDYHLCVLVYDKKYGQRIKEILCTSVKAVSDARKMNATILPNQVFKDAVTTVNHRLGSEGFMKLWSTIMYIYKTFYLIRPGAWIRNWIDTNLKTWLELKDETREYKNQARAIIRHVNRLEQMFITRSPNGSGIIDRKGLQVYIENNRDTLPFTWEEYKALSENYFTQSVAGNVTKEFFDEEEKNVLTTFKRITGAIINWGNQTEEVNRLAVYLYNLDRGMDYTDALYALSKRHFDYGYKTELEQLTELVFPFSTFASRNYSFWIDIMTKHPSFLRNYTNLMTPNWDFDAYTPQDLANNRAIQSHILNGHIQLPGEYNDKLAYFKINPSVQSALNLATNPIYDMYSRLAAPLSAPLNVLNGDDPKYAIPDILPGVGALNQTAQTMFKTGSPAPSIISVSKPPRKSAKNGKNLKWSNGNLNKANQYTKDYKPRYQNNIIYDAYKTIGKHSYRMRMYPIVDIAHEIKQRYSVNVYNRVKNRAKVDVFQGIRYRIRLDTNKFRT